MCCRNASKIPAKNSDVVHVESIVLVNHADAIRFPLPLVKCSIV
jgi:hypothetical protein